MQVYNIMSDTNAAFAERTIRSLKNVNLKKVTNRIMGTSKIKNCKLSHFMKTVNSDKNRWIDLIPKYVLNFHIWSDLYSKPLRQFTEAKFRIAVIVCISKYDLPFRKRYKPQFQQDVSEVVAIS